MRLKSLKVGAPFEIRRESPTRRLVGGFWGGWCTYVHPAICGMMLGNWWTKWVAECSLSWGWEHFDERYDAALPKWPSFREVYIIWNTIGYPQMDGETLYGWYYDISRPPREGNLKIKISGLWFLNCWHSHPQACKHPKTDALRTQAFEEVSSAAADPSLSLQASYQHALGQMHREQLWPTVVVSVQTGSRIETVRSSVSESFLRTCLLHLLSDGGTVSECCFRCNCKRWRLVVVNTDVKESTDSQVPFLKYVCMWICFFPTMICWISGSTLSHAKF